MKKRKIVSSLIAAFIMCLTLVPGVQAFAKDNIPNNTPIEETGSLSIHLSDTKYQSSKKDVVFGIAKVADWKDGLFEALEGIDIDFNDIDTADQMESVARKLKKTVQPNIEITTDENGIAKADNLTTGLYLGYVLENADYENVSPFLVSIPRFDEVEKVMDYDVTVLPKHEAFPKLKINKVDSDSKNLIQGKSFEFTVFNDKDCKQKILSQESVNGVVEFEFKDEGIFYIKETKSPAGFKLSSEIVKVEFMEKGLKINDQILEHDVDNVYSIEYANYKETVNTGTQTNMKKFIQIMAGSLFLGSLLVFMNRKQKRD